MGFRNLQENCKYFVLNFTKILRTKPKITIDELFSHFCEVPTKIEIPFDCDSITLKSVSLSKLIEIKLVWKLQIRRKNWSKFHFKRSGKLQSYTNKMGSNYSWSRIWIFMIPLRFHKICMYLRISYSIDDLIFENKPCEIVGVEYYK